MSTRVVRSVIASRSWLVLLGAALAGGLSYPMASSAQVASDLVKWQFFVTRDANDSTAYELSINADIADKWKMYAMDSPRPSRGVRFLLDRFPPDIKPGKAEQAEPQRGFDEGFQKDVSFFKKRAEFKIPVTYEWSYPETPVVGGIILYQICNDESGLCLPPTRQLFSFEFVASDKPCVNHEEVDCEVEEIDFGESPPNTGDLIDSNGQTPAELSLGRQGDLSRPASRSGNRGGFAGFLLLAIGAGLGALLTPCVFPMIPLTVSYFTSDQRTRAQTTKLAAFFGSSIVILFTGLGLILSLVVGAAGSQTIAANPWVNLLIAGVLIVFALSLLGFFEIRLPNRLLNAVNKKGDAQTGWVGALFMGLTITLVSFSCTAPFVGGLLAAASAGAWFRPLVGMAAFSATFALPFVLFALFPNLLAKLPKSGSWMQTFKVVLGFVELAAAVKFISNADLVLGIGALSRPLAIAIVFVIFVLTALYLFGWLRLPNLEQHRPALFSPRLGFGLFFLAVAIYLVPGFLGAPRQLLDAYLPPRQASDFQLLSGIDPDMDVTADERWYVDDVDAAVAEARRSAKPLLVDFTGFTCTNCRQMESTVFVKTSVSERLTNDFVLLRLVTDGAQRGMAFQALQLRLTGTTALPTYVILDDSGKHVLEKQSGMMTVDEFLSFLNFGEQRHRESLAVLNQ